MISQNTQTIVQKISSLQYYNFERLDSHTLAIFSDSLNQSHFSKNQRKISQYILKMFECYLQITNQTFISANIASLKNQRTVTLFIGALWSNKFIQKNIEKQCEWIRIFIKILNSSKITRYLSAHWIDTTPSAIKKYFDLYAKKFEEMPLLNDRVYYWHGWWAFNKINIGWFVPLNGIYTYYGREFTDRLFNVIKAKYSETARSIVHVVPHFFRWLPASGYTLDQFNDPLSVQNLFQDYLKNFLTIENKFNDEISIKHMIEYWRVFITFVENTLLGNIFAEPFGKLISPQPSKITGKERRIKKIGNGIDVKGKLLTEIPLHVTDEKVLEILFCQIQKDFDHVTSVAEKLADNLWSRYLRRKKLSKIGLVKPIKSMTKLEGDARGWLINKNNPNWLSNAAATFEFHGFVIDSCGEPLACSKSHPTGFVAYELGLPTCYALIPYMVLLVAEHPNIVPSFLTEFELYNKQGKLTGFVKQDSFYVLDGRKKRRGPSNAQQIITLTDNSLKLVEQIISITDCVRNHLKNNGDDNWRYLFLSSNKSFSPERMSRQYSRAKKSYGTFFQELAKKTGNITEKEAKKLSTHFQLGAVRASKAVLIYLKSRCAKTMAEALGHKEYGIKLLSHYLPEPILDFFQSRWIRIFQQGLIVEAMKDSPYLLHSTEFNTIDEFHEFMKNHALKTIPTYLENPYDTIDQQNLNSIDEIIFNVNAGTLSLLLSIQKAVSNAKKPVCGIASYWSELTSHLVKHIENGSQHASNQEFKHYLKIARDQINSEKMGAIIYA